jgi:hypothetical protein
MNPNRRFPNRSTVAAAIAFPSSRETSFNRKRTMPWQGRPRPTTTSPNPLSAVRQNCIVAVSGIQDEGVAEARILFGYVENRMPSLAQLTDVKPVDVFVRHQPHYAADRVG